MNNILSIFAPHSVPRSTLIDLSARLRSIKGKIGEDDEDSQLDLLSITQPDAIGHVGWLCHLSVPYPQSTFRVNWLWSQCLDEIRNVAGGAPIALQLSASYVYVEPK